MKKLQDQRFKVQDVFLNRNRDLTFVVEIPIPEELIDKTKVNAEFIKNVLIYFNRNSMDKRCGYNSMLQLKDDHFELSKEYLDYKELFTSHIGITSFPFPAKMDDEYIY